MLCISQAIALSPSTRRVSRAPSLVWYVVRGTWWQVTCLLNPIDDEESVLAGGGLIALLSCGHVMEQIHSRSVLRELILYWSTN